MEDANGEITWTNFKNEFLDKLFLVDVRSCKEIEFLELKRGNMIVAYYAAKFEELLRSSSRRLQVGVDQMREEFLLL